MLKETQSQGLHVKTKLRHRKLVGRTNSCFFTFPSLLRGKSFRQRWAMIPAARASPRTLIMVRNLSLQRRRGQETLWDQNYCWKYQSLFSHWAVPQQLIMFVTYRMKSQCYDTFWDLMLPDVCYFADSNFRYKTLSASLLLSLTGSSRWPRWAWCHLAAGPLMSVRSPW